MEYLFKVLVCGDMGCGKTCFTRRYVHDLFTESYKATIGVDFTLKVIQWTKQDTVRIQLWDLAGSERVGGQTSVYFRDAEGALVLYDLERPETRLEAINWKNDLDSKLRIPVLLVANKLDLRSDEQRARDVVELQKVARGRNFLDWCMISVKEDYDSIEQERLKEIDRAMKILIREMIKRRGEKKEEEEEEEFVIQLDIQDLQKKKRKKCC